MAKVGLWLILRFLTATNMWRNAGDYVKRWGAALIRGAATNAEFTVFRKTKGIGDKQKLQDDIDKLVRWSEKWQMLFNFGKCKCLHTGPGNTGMKNREGKRLRGLNEC